jgi:hypothetical protein
MTRKDYVLIAKAIKGTYFGNKTWVRNCEQISDTIARALQSDNPRFDKGRFLKACGVE